MDRQEYAKFIIGTPDVGKIALLKEACENAKKKGHKTGAFYNMRRKQLQAIVRDKRWRSSET